MAEYILQTTDGCAKDKDAWIKRLTVKEAAIMVDKGRIEKEKFKSLFPNVWRILNNVRIDT